MLTLQWVTPIICVLVGLGDSWNLFPTLPRESLHSYAKQKISDLKNLRTILQTQRTKIVEAKLSQETNDLEKYPTVLKTIELNDTNQNSSEVQKHIKTIELSDESWINSFSTNLNLSSKESDNQSFLQQIFPKREFLKKISEIRDKLEPEVKKYFTDKYNSFLSNLVPYSETIGVPTYVLNSLKIPQNFDPRWQIIESLLENSSVDRILKDISPNKIFSAIEGRSDDQELVSDQEPDATSKGQKKYQHIYLSSRNRPKGYLVPDKTGYEISFDSVGGPFGQDTLDSNIYSKGYYIDEYPYTSKNDMYAAAGSHVGRGHGHSRGDHGGGYGHGHGGGGHGGLMDPFTILGGLAFLTYLGLLIQQSLNRTGAAGRSISDEWELGGQTRRIPVVLTKLNFNDQFPQSTDIETPKSLDSSTNPVKKEQKDDLMSTVQKNLDDSGVETNSSKKIGIGNLECRQLCRILRKLHISQKFNASKTVKNSRTQALKNSGGHKKLLKLMS